VDGDECFLDVRILKLAVNKIGHQIIIIWVLIIARQHFMMSVLRKAQLTHLSVRAVIK